MYFPYESKVIYPNLDLRLKMRMDELFAELKFDFQAAKTFNLRDLALNKLKQLITLYC
jgi:hypothetical protein